MASSQTWAQPVDQYVWHYDSRIIDCIKMYKNYQIFNSIILALCLRSLFMISIIVINKRMRIRIKNLYGLSKIWNWYWKICINKLKTLLKSVLKQ